jgi:hypothetical protein
MFQTVENVTFLSGQFPCCLEDCGDALPRDAHDPVVVAYDQIAGRHGRLT